MKWFNLKIKLLETSTITGLIYSFVMVGPMIIPGRDIFMGLALRSVVLLNIFTRLIP